MSLPPLPDTIRAARWIWLLDLEWAGTVYRAATDTVEAPDLAGTSRPYAPGLRPREVMDRIDFRAADPTPRSAVVEVLVDPSVLNVPDVVARGWSLTAGIATLRLWVEGTEGADAVFLVYMEGAVEDPQHGLPTEPVEFTLTEFPFDDRALMPAPTARVCRATWGTQYDDTIHGRYYPLPFGHPGYAFDSAVGRKSATPAFLVDTDGDGVTYSGEFLIAGYHVKASEVRLRDLTTGDDEDCTVINTVDDLGQDVAVIRIPFPFVDVEAVQGHEYAICWSNNTNDVQDGMRGKDGEAARSLWDILLYCLEQTTVRWDREQIGALRAELSIIPLDGAIVVEEPVSPWKWAAENLLPLAGLAPVPGPKGVRLIRWRDLPPASLIPVHLVVTGVDPDTGEDVPNANCEAASPIGASRLDGVYNDLTLKFMHSPPKQGWYGRVRVVGDPAVPDLDEDATLNPRCRVSRTYFGTRSKVVKTDVVWDPAAAGTVMQSLILQYALPTVPRTLRADQGLGFLSPGTQVRVTDAARYWTACPAVVEGVRWGDSGVIDVEVRAIFDPARMVGG